MRSTLALAVCVVSVLSCASPTFVTTRYSPFHPENDAPVTFQIDAEDEDGIETVQLYLYEYEMNQDVAWQAIVPRPNGRWGHERSWALGGQTVVHREHTLEEGFPESTLLLFRFNVIDSNGQTTDEAWGFAAGEWPFGDEPIPLLLGGEAFRQISLAFVADWTDYDDPREVLPELETLVFDGYHTNHMISGDNRKYWRFFYSPQLGFASDFNMGQQMVVPSGVINSGTVDHAIIVHSSEKRDWSDLTNFSVRTGHIGIAVHEAGHGVFGLSDEYDGGPSFQPDGEFPNVFGTDWQANQHNQTYGWPADAEPIEPPEPINPDFDVPVLFTNWRVEPAAHQCVMIDSGQTEMRDFAYNCAERVQWLYSTLDLPMDAQP